MSSKWLMMRHAKSRANEDFTLARNMADAGIELCEAGILQAIHAGHTLAEYAATLDPAIKKIRLISSPYKRAQQTMQFVEAKCRINFEVTQETNDLLREKGFGKYEGYHLDDLVDVFGEEAKSFLREFNDLSRKYEARPPARLKSEGSSHDHPGESYKDANDRARIFVENIILQDDGDPDTLNVIISHGRFNTFLEKELMGMPDQDFLSIPIYDNGAFKCFEKALNGFEDKGLVFEGFRNGQEHGVEKLYPRSGSQPKISKG